LDPFDLLDRLRSGEIVSNEQKARARDYALQVVELESKAIAAFNRKLAALSLL
jgi:post-segregation antitoxin (ccd killing protein)